MLTPAPTKVPLLTKLATGLSAVAIAIKQPTLFDEKKLHLFRIMCTNVLDSKGGTAAERETHLGWKSTIETRHYTSPKFSAMYSVLNYWY